MRNCLAAGDVEGAAEALGRPFTVRGVVVQGDQRGRELGYPTANVPTTGLAAAPAVAVLLLATACSGGSGSSPELASATAARRAASVS